jgi:glycosyltransferase involved in cell wall biosynthesis
VMCLDETGGMAGLFEREGVRVELLDAPRLNFVQRIRRLRSRLQALGADVLHTHNPGPLLHGSAARMAGGVPVLIHTKHGRNSPEHRRSVRIARVASMAADRVVAVSEDAAAVAKEIEHVSSRKISVIHNGVEIAPPRAAGVRSAKRAIAVARLHPVKDHATLLQAARLVVDAEPDFQLDIVGDGECRPDLEALTERLGLRRCVRFLGIRTDVRELLDQAGVFVLSSLSEGISMTLLEAMSAALPIVATRVGGTPEVVSHGTTGYLVPPRDRHALAAAIVTLIGRPVKARQLGLAGRRRVESKFDVRHTVRAYEDLYLRTLAAC